MAEKTVKVELTGTYTWGGKKYGPGEATVPAALAEWLGLEPIVEVEEKPARKPAAKAD